MIARQASLPRRLRVSAGAAVAEPASFEWLRRAVFLTFASVLPLATAGQEARDGSGKTRTDAQWLTTIQRAAQQQSYVGTIVYQRGAEVRASRITHYFDGAVVHERVQPLDGRLREYIRRGRETQCLYPDTRRIVFERSARDAVFPALDAAEPAEILGHYALRVGGRERVANLECQVLTLEPRDAMRYGFRLCLDAESGLMLKAQTLNDQHEAIEQVAFTEVRVGEKIDPTALAPSWSTQGWRVERPAVEVADLARYGWTVSAPQGFRKLREVVRRFAGSTPETPALQAVLSDGLATVSVFIDAATEEIPEPPAVSRPPVNSYARRVGSSTVTVIGEVPPATVRAIAETVEFRQVR